MKKSFTLIELLAVIAVLGIVLTIAIPQIKNSINNSKKSSFTINTKMLIKKIDLLLVENRNYDVSSINADNIEELFKVNNDNIKKVIVTKINEKTNVEIVGKNKWQGYIATGTFDNLEIVGLEYDDENPVVVFETNGSSVDVNSGE